MKHIVFAFCLLVAALPAFAQDAVTLNFLDEKLQKLRAEVEDLQFRVKKTEQTLDAIRTEIRELRIAGGGASPEQLQALEAKITALDAARQRDKQAIIDQVANLLGSSGKSGVPTATGKEHTVAKGETLSAIARQYGVTVAELKKANGLSGDVLAVGQKLTIPGK